MLSLLLYIDCHVASKETSVVTCQNLSEKVVVTAVKKDVSEDGAPVSEEAEEGASATAVKTDVDDVDFQRGVELQHCFCEVAWNIIC